MEYHHLLVKAQRFSSAEADIEAQEEAKMTSLGAADTTGLTMSPLMPAGDERGSTSRVDEMAFSNIAGVLPSGDRVRFERMLFRATRGNCFVRFSALSGKAVDAFGVPIPKVCFIIFYKSQAIELKIKKICDAFNCNRYDLSLLNHPKELEAIKQSNFKELNDAKTILDKNIESRTRLCAEAAKNLEEWLWIVRREKGTYHTLNLFKNDVATNLLRGRAWVLTSKIPAARAAIHHAHSALNLPNTSMLERVPAGWPTPPTHFEVNKYQVAFQEFVNTYGVPRYKEVNPALFTAATFPFLFGVMYGDIGHGTCLALGGLFLILTERFINNRMSDMMQGIYVARYMLFAMGLMAIYAGLVYNDYFSLGLNLFGSKWVYTSEEDGALATNLYSYGDPNSVYAFGVDPAWRISSNELLFANSMKMKMSVILGIFHMTFGIILKGMNAVYFRSWLDLVCEFIPMILFDIAFFGYMVILIFVKWSIDWNHRMALGSCAYDKDGVFGACQLSNTVTSCYTSSGSVCTASTLLVDMCPLQYGGTGGGCQPPNLITTLINIALSPGSVDEPMYAGQDKVQTFLLLVAFFCVPVILLAKPLYLKFTHKPAEVPKDAEAANPLIHDDVEDYSNPHGASTEVADSHGGGGHGGHGEEFNFGEIIIHQAIETIEFVLGMVSNTASYLRLWALSLAHSELAHVFWSKAMLSMITTNNPVLIFMGFAVFACVTFGVLLAMDVLECFLHALRLHWVEFQNKFYKADGYKFQPFDFKALLDKTYLD